MPFFDLVTLIMHPQLSELEGGDYNYIEILDSPFYPICVKWIEKCQRDADQSKNKPNSLLDFSF